MGLTRLFLTFSCLDLLFCWQILLFLILLPAIDATESSNQWGERCPLKPLLYIGQCDDIAKMSVDKYFDWAERCALDVRFREADACNECLCAHFGSRQAKPLRKEWLLDGGRQAQRLPRGGYMRGMRLAAWVMEDRTGVDTPGMEEVVVEPRPPSSGASTVLPPPPDLTPSPKLLQARLEQEEGQVVMKDEISTPSSPVPPAPAFLRGVGTSGENVAIWIQVTVVVAIVVIAVAAIKIIRFFSRRWFSRQQRPTKASKPDPEESSKKKTSKPRATADQTIASLGQQRGLQMEAGRQARQSTVAARKNYLRS